MKHLMTLLGAVMALVVAADTAQANPKKDYCSNQTYYTNSGANDGSTYPHLHCGKDFLTYSPGKKSSRYNIIKSNSFRSGTAGSACSKADSQSAANLKAKIKQVCDDEKATCTGC